MQHTDTVEVSQKYQRQQGADQKQQNPHSGQPEYVDIKKSWLGEFNWSLALNLMSKQDETEIIIQSQQLKN